jgi:large subunit ribosomal protein L34
VNGVVFFCILLEDPLSAMALQPLLARAVIPRAAAIPSAAIRRSSISTAVAAPPVAVFFQQHLFHPSSSSSSPSYRSSTASAAAYALSPPQQCDPHTRNFTEIIYRDLVEQEGWVPTAEILEGLLQHAPPAGGVGEEVGDPAQSPNAPVHAVKRTFQPSTIRKKRKHGFMVRLKDEEGRKTIHRRRLKGRSRLSM